MGRRRQIAFINPKTKRQQFFINRWGKVPFNNLASVGGEINGREALGAQADQEICKGNQKGAWHKEN